MSRKKRRSEKDNPAQTSEQSAPAGLFTLQRARLALLGGLVAVLTAWPLTASEAPGQGLGVFYVTGLCLLLIGWAGVEFLGLFTRQAPFRMVLGPVGAAVGLLALAMAASAVSVATTGSGNARAAINMSWQWAGLAIIFFLVRQWVRDPRAMRAVASVMIGLAVLLAVAGFYQYFYSMPVLRGEYAENPESMLRAAGVVAPEGSPQREQFESRISSVEPMATFSLTNSLAGFLATWLMVTLGVALSGLRRRTPLQEQAATSEQPGLSSPALTGLAIAGVLIAGCLVLTKSRTAFLAAGLGVVLLALYGGLIRKQVNWKLPLGLAGVVVLLALGATLAGGLDAQVMSEAPKSLLYRVEYWKSTAAMILDHPWLGVGPGNFQQFYAGYKLPQASEMVADPHNFLLEVWATGGTLALVALLAALGQLAWTLAHRARASERNEVSTGDESKLSASFATVSDDDPKRQVKAIYIGAGVGVFVSIPVGWMIGLPSDLAMVLFGLFAGGCVVYLLDSWVAEGQLSLAPLCVALVVLLVNLLAAGGIGFGAVSLNVWLLMALSLNHAFPQESPWRMLWNGSITAIASSVGVTVLCIITLYTPVLDSKVATPSFSEMQRMTPQQLEERLFRAIEADSFNPEPWSQLAMLRESLWQAKPTDRKFERFESAVKEYLQRDPQHYSAQAEVSNMYLRMYRSRPSEKLLATSLKYQQAAIQRFPNSAILHAQAAWLLYLQGESKKAREEAKTALSLDEQHPHQEQKLNRQKIFDPAAPPDGPGPTNAEEVMERFLDPSPDVA